MTCELLTSIGDLSPDSFRTCYTYDRAEVCVGLGRVTELVVLCRVHYNQPLNMLMQPYLDDIDKFGYEHIIYRLVHIYTLVR